MGVLTHDTAFPDHLWAGEPGRGSPSAGPVRWPVSDSFSWGLSRAAGYGLLSVAVAGLYLAVVAVAGGLSGIGGGPSTRVLATVMAAGMLLPVRGRLQRRIDRLFFGDRGAPYAAMARLGRRVAEVTALREALDASQAELVTARDDERRRLRRDLHDGLGPTLAGLTLGLDTVCAMSAGPRELDDLLTRLKAETQRAVTDIRRIVYGLRPPALDELGLAGALREQLTRLERQAPWLSITLDLPAQGVAGLPAAVEVAAYRIVTEAVTNVLRHAGAHRCEVRIRACPELRLRVCDDGVGMPGQWRAGVGITSMRERVAELGGELAIEAGRPHGTRIAARLPLRRPQ